ncbi:MAG: 50S ribosomal protein L35 [Planctomycetota bacterium]|nr:50S ribosomal protein L35 [Planctomycetota bacterium]
MPKNKSHKGLLKRVKITKSGKVRFKAPHSRHLKSNKTGTQVQSYRKNRYARGGNLRELKKLLFRPLRSQEQFDAAKAKKMAAEAAEVDMVTATASTTK